MRVSLTQVLTWCVLGGDWIDYKLEGTVDFQAMLGAADERQVALFSNRITMQILNGCIPIKASLFVRKQLVNDPYVLQYAEAEHRYLDGSEHQTQSPHSFCEPRAMPTEAQDHSIDPRTIRGGSSIDFARNSIGLDWSAAPELKPTSVYLPVPDKKRGFDKIHSTMDAEPQYTDTEVYQFELEAKHCTVNSFDVEAYFVPGKMETPKGKPGPKHKYEWDEMWIRLAAYLRKNDLPDSQVKIEAVLESFFPRDGAPGRTELQKRSRKIMELREHFED